MANVQHREERSGGGNLGNAASDMGSQVRDAAETAKNKVQEFGANVRDAAKERVENLRDTASEYIEQGREKAVELEESLERTIKQRPLTAVLVAAGIGFALGMLCTRRHD